MNIRMQSLSDLEAIIGLNSWLRRPQVRSLKIDLLDIDGNQVLILEKRIKRLFNDCGCFWAAPVFLGVFLILFGLQFAGNSFAWSAILSSFAISIVVGMIAKFSAMYWSYKELQKELEQLLTYYSRSLL